MLKSKLKIKKNNDWNLKKEKQKERKKIGRNE